jgi:hypothetical protein
MITWKIGPVKGVSSVTGKLSKLKEVEARNVALRAWAMFILPLLKAYPAYKYVSRKRAYGQTFFSDRQRRYVMAAIRSGEISIGNNRTGYLEKSWTVARPYGGQVSIRNSAPYAGYVVGDGQARQPGMVGWKKANDIIRANMSKAIAVAKNALISWLGF